MLSTPNLAAANLAQLLLGVAWIPMGSALGLATMTALATSRGADALGDAPALTDGYSAAFLGAAAIAVAGALLAALTLRVKAPAAVEATESQEDVSIAA